MAFSIKSGKYLTVHVFWEERDGLGGGGRMGLPGRLIGDKTKILPFKIILLSVSFLAVLTMIVLICFL